MAEGLRGGREKGRGKDGLSRLSEQKNGMDRMAHAALFLVPKPGLEPGRASPLPPQDSVSTKFHHFGICV